MLRIENLAIHFEDRKERQEVVRKLSFSMEEGEVLGIVGESGSGKSMTALAIAGLLKENAVLDSGGIYWKRQKDDENPSGETDLLRLSEKEMRKIQGNEISMIFQEPMTALNPTMRIGKQLAEALCLHTDLPKEKIRRRGIEALAEAELDDPETLWEKYPHELSGGMRQRVMIAAAIVCRPRLLIADEPTTALDVNTQESILKLLKKLNRKYGMGILFISHNLRVVSELCERVLVMKDGVIVEEGAAEEIFANPKQEYTKELIAAIPKHTGVDRMQEIPETEMSEKEIPEKKVPEKEIQEKEKPEKKIPESEIPEKEKPEKKVTGKKKVLELKAVNAYYKERKTKRQVLKNVSFTLNEGETVGLVGESGSGKTTLCRCILGLLKDYEGEVTHYTKQAQMVFQDPYGSLNPKKTVGWILEEPLRIRKQGTKEARRAQAEAMLAKVHLPKEIYGRYPRELSGGQRQRVSIALALMTGTKFILADEPLSALDVTVQAQMIALLKELKEQEQICCLFVSHDMDVVNMLCDRVLCLKDGEVRWRE